MKVRCIYNQLKHVAPEHRMDSQSDEVEYYYPFEKGCEYDLMGLQVQKTGRVELLTVGDGLLTHESPSWGPKDLFEITDNQIHGAWEVCMFKDGYEWLLENTDIIFLMGYKELVSDWSHFQGLYDCEKKDLDLFYSVRERLKKQREEMELWGIQGY